MASSSGCATRRHIRLPRMAGKDWDNWAVYSHRAKMRMGIDANVSQYIFETFKERKLPVEEMEYIKSR